VIADPYEDLLQIGLTAKQFEYTPGSLAITDEPLSIQGAKVIDPTSGLNPLPLPYREAREFAAALFPDKDLMTYRNGRRALTRLVMKAGSLDTIRYGRNDDDEEAKGVVEDTTYRSCRRNFGTGQCSCRCWGRDAPIRTRRRWRFTPSSDPTREDNRYNRFIKDAMAA
jgi:hypothetical protein